MNALFGFGLIVLFWCFVKYISNLIETVDKKKLQRIDNLLMLPMQIVFGSIFIVCTAIYLAIVYIYRMIIGLLRMIISIPAKLAS